MANNPRKELALAQYHFRAKQYDCELAAFEPIRLRAIACLHLQPGEIVFDVGCGTGLSFELLRQGVGPQGQVVGIEQSPDMLAIAKERIDAQGWRNVRLLPMSAELVDSPYIADAALFHFTHDVLSSACAIANIVHQLKPGARWVAAGLQWSHPWDWHTNMLVLAAAMYSMTTLDGLSEPWAKLATFSHPVTKVPSPMNGTYIVSASLRTDPTAHGG